MINPEDLKDSIKISENAIERIMKEGLAPTPEVYAVLYVYYGGSNPDVTRAVDILVSKEGKITKERCLEIYTRFMKDNSNDDFVEKAGNIVNATLQDMSFMMKSVQSATTQYSDSLDDVNDIAKSSGNPEQLQGVIERMMSETKKIMDENKALEHKLDQSSRNIKKLKSEVESVKKEAITDGLTGLANRKYFDLEIERLAAECDEQSEKQLSLLIMDIDHFKAFNDTYGHQVGDQVLRLVGQTLQQGIKGKDFAARYGGEEFCVLLPDTPLDIAAKVGDSLRQAVANKEVINRTSGQKLGKITMSVGVSQYRPNNDTVAECIERADGALYKAKDSGRNRVEVAE